MDPFVRIDRRPREIIICGPDKAKLAEDEANFRKLYGPKPKIVTIFAEQPDLHLIFEPNDERTA